MTEIEDLVRQALAQTPTVPVTRTDPLAALDRRVRRARRWFAAGAGAVAAAVAAAIVVPLAVAGGSGGPNSVKPITPPTQSPAPHPLGTEVLVESGAIWSSTDDDGRRWLLYTTDGHQMYVGKVVTGKIEDSVAVEGPADYIVSGDHVVWVIGGGDGGSQQSRLTAIDTRTGDVATETVDQAVLSYGAVANDSLYVDWADATDSKVIQVAARSGHILTLSSTDVPHAGEIAVTANKHIWVQSGHKLVEFGSPAPGVDWSGDIYGPAKPGDSLWAYDGDRLIGLTPKYLQACVSCAEGYRVSVTGRPSAVVQTHDGGLYVGLADGGLDYYSPDSLSSGDTPASASLAGVQMITMAADPDGGVDYVDDQGRLLRWSAQVATAR